MIPLALGGTVPPEILEYLEPDALKDANAKFLVVQGRVITQSKVFGATYYFAQNKGVLITIGKEYRIVQMSYYVKPRSETNKYGQTLVFPGEHTSTSQLAIIPNMVTIYSSLQEARLASEMATIN